MFANPAITGFSVAGLLYGGGSQAMTWFMIQAIGVVAAGTLVFAISYGFIKVLGVFMAVRANYDEEVLGLDAVDHGVSEDHPIPVPSGSGTQGAIPSSY
ncbi:MAG: hypothetical protein WKH64_00315 [Chloroflexia bacterium]